MSDASEHRPASHGPESSQASEAPAMGERRARWGYGYQDKVATAEVLDHLRADIRDGTARLQAVRLADLSAGRVDDFVLQFDTAIQGNSIKWSGAGEPMNWGALIGTDGLVRELADGWLRLRREWGNKEISVRLQTNRPASTATHPSQLVTAFSVAQFFTRFWKAGPSQSDSANVSAVWRQIAAFTGLTEAQFHDFVRATEVRFGYPEPPPRTGESQDERVYLRQFDDLHKAIATWLTNNPDGDTLDRRYLLDAVGFRAHRSGLVQRFPNPEIPYERNSEAALQIKKAIDSLSGGYLAVTGIAGVGKSTLVQDVLSEYPFFVPYYAYLPDGVGNPRDRGEALTFFQDVATRLDRFFDGRRSLGIDDISQGREALRDHMQKAHRLFMSEGYKTILLIDGLDHVQREPGLERPLLFELPRPDEVPDGFIIILSSQPQALRSDVIERHVAATVSTSPQRRCQVEGLSRDELYRIAEKANKHFSHEDREALVSACQRNPLILTYLLRFTKAHPHLCVAYSIKAIGDYSGDIDRYYESALSGCLEKRETRHLLAILSRAVPPIPIPWIQTWPERSDFEEIFERHLAPFVRVEGSNLYFIHNSLLVFLKNATRSSIPGTDLERDERLYHSQLAERCGTAPCSDRVGRAKVFHLLRSESYSELLQFISSSWFREGIESFLPYAELHPLVLNGFAAAWKVKDYGEVIRLILLAYELSQRTDRIEAGDLARQLLFLGRPIHAINQIRSAGRILVEDKYALEAAADLYVYGADCDDRDVRRVAREIYLQAKPLSYIYRSEPIDRRTREAIEVLGKWADVAPCFESPESITNQLQQIHFAQGLGEWDEPEEVIKAALVYRSAMAALAGGATFHECSPFFCALARLKSLPLLFSGVLASCDDEWSPGLVRKLKRYHSRLPSNRDSDLRFAELLLATGETEQARRICATLSHTRIDEFRSQHSFGLTGISYTVRLSRLQTALGLETGNVPSVTDEDSEATGRIESAAREIGALLAKADSKDVPKDLRQTFRSLLLFHNRPVTFPSVTIHSRYMLSQATHKIHAHLRDVGQVIGREGIEALRDAFVEVLSSPAAEQFTPLHRRTFALFFYRKRALGAGPSIEIGLSSDTDIKTDDPAERQQACLEVAVFLRRLGQDAEADIWAKRASAASAGSGNHKDYHMWQLSEWLMLSCGRNIGAREAAILEKFIRALEVAGGDGGSRALSTALRGLVAKDADRSMRLAIDVIDRGLLNVADTLTALLHGAVDAGASPALVRGIYCELLSLIQTGDTSEVAIASTRTVPLEFRGSYARELVSAVRTNSLPDHRVGIARSLQDSLEDDGLEPVSLAAGLAPGHQDSSSKSWLYTLSTGDVLTIRQMTRRLSDPLHPELWNPNPSENKEFNWYRALVDAEVKDLAHVESLIATFPLPDYKQVDLLAWKSRVFLQSGDRAMAQELAEHALRLAGKDGSWFDQLDGARQRVAFSAMMPFDEAATVGAARKRFGDDLASGKLWNRLLLDDIVDIFRFLQLEWPSESVLRVIDDYVDNVLAVSRQTNQISALLGSSALINADTALCRFVIKLLAFPVVDVGVAARRALARFANEDQQGPALLLSEASSCDSVQLEHLLVCIEVNSQDISSLRSAVQLLNEHESAAVRAIARRICTKRGWPWQEVRNRVCELHLQLPKSRRIDRREDILSPLTTGETITRLHKRIIAALEKSGNDAEQLCSELMQLYWKVESQCLWHDEQRLQRWINLVNARFWLNPRALIGREACMRLLGRFALSGLTPEGIEDAYDLLYPVYDSRLELTPCIEKPSEVCAMEWGILDEGRKGWLKGEGAADWTSYPDTIGQFRILGERTLFIRPDWEWPREERYRGVSISPSKSRDEKESFSSERELTYQLYLEGVGQPLEQLVVWNDERQLVGPAYRWVAINSNIARSMGWIPSDSNPFEWNNSSGEMMVKSVFWRNGWVGLEPPHIQCLGEGWLVVATETGLSLIRKAFPHSSVHLWVGRYSHGKEPYEGTWHLRCPLNRTN